MGAGYEYDIIKTPHHTFNLGGGINHVSLEYNDGTPTIEGPAGRIALEYNGKLMENIRLTQKLAVLGMDDFTMKSSVTNLEYVFTRNVSVSLDHEITDYSRIARTSQEETETSTSLNLNFNF